MVDFPAPLGPSMEMKRPRSWSEKGRSVILVPSRCVAEFFQRQRTRVRDRGEADKEPGGHQCVIRGAVRGEVVGKVFGQLEFLN
jgi:hypothetical protein